MRRGRGSTIPAWRLASRLARREVRRRPGRTALVALLIALPVAGMTSAAALMRTEAATPMERWRAQFGRADAVRQSGTGDAAGLPPGSRVLSARLDTRVARTSTDARTWTTFSDLDLTDPMTDGMVRVTAGRVPTRADEVLFSSASARDLGVEPGDVVELTRPAALRLTVTGIGEKRSDWGSRSAVLGRGTQFPWRDSSWAGGLGTSALVLVDLPDGVAPDAAYTGYGLRFSPELESRAPFLDLAASGDAGEKVAWTLVVGAVVLTVVGVVIAAAFAAGARRQLTTLGQLAANGAPPRTLRRVLLLEGTWTGLAGAVAGVALGGVVLAAFASRMDSVIGRDVDPYRIAPGDIAGIVALGVLAATAAAFVPAVSASKVGVLAALAGRRPLRRVPGWLAPTGAAVTAVGLALLFLAVLGAKDSPGDDEPWVLTGIVGGMAILLGACAITPRYVSVLEPVGHRLGGAWRLAARSLARQRTRTSGVVSAVCATCALTVGGAAMVATQAAALEDEAYMVENQVHVHAHVPQGFAYGADGRPRSAQVRPDEVAAPIPPDAVERLGAALGRHDVHRLTVAYRRELTMWAIATGTTSQSGTGPGGSVTIGDDAAAAVYGLGEEARRDLERVGVLALTKKAGGDVAVELRKFDVGVLSGSPTRVEAATAAVGQKQFGFLPEILITPAKAAELGLATVPGPVVLQTPQPLTREQRASIAEISDELFQEAAEAADRTGARPAMLGIGKYDPPNEISPVVLEALLAAVALGFTMFVLATMLALSAVESRSELDVLTVVGAPPRVLRRASGRKALLLTALGAAVAVPLGYATVWVVMLARGDADSLVFPWRVAALLLIAAPLVTGAMTTAGSALAARLKPVRISTMAFE